MAIQNWKPKGSEVDRMSDYKAELDEFRRTLATIRNTPHVQNAHIMACALAQRVIDTLVIIIGAERIETDSEKIARLAKKIDITEEERKWLAHHNR
jgi:hypothetical protein